MSSDSFKGGPVYDNLALFSWCMYRCVPACISSKHVVVLPETQVTTEQLNSVHFAFISLKNGTSSTGSNLQFLLNAHILNLNGSATMFSQLV